MSWQEKIIDRSKMSLEALIPGYFGISLMRRLNAMNERLYQDRRINEFEKSLGDYVGAAIAFMFDVGTFAGIMYTLGVDDPDKIFWVTYATAIRQGWQHYWVTITAIRE